ncbi:acyl-CoA dehydrogenase family protein [Sphingobium mellinum]|uniref:acyl-CoA dehydrogenase family protein n=1 Tax=Sphingobium mellinum TaxID=1387166 RepID=UPI0030EB5461
MDLTLSYEQEEFRATTRRLLDAAPVHAAGFDAAAYAAAWVMFAQAGVAGLCLKPQWGGFSGEPEDIALIAAELGRAPGAAPRIETMVMSAMLLSAGSSPLVEALRNRLAAGTLQPAVACHEGGDPFGRDQPCTQVRPAGEGYVLTGRKAAAIGAETADCLIVSAQLPSGELALLTIDPSEPGIDRFGYRLFDTTPVADLVFHDVPVAVGGLIAQGQAARVALDEAFDGALLAQCAAALGGIDRAIELSIFHLKTRQQFGQPLAGFQVLQHRVADMFIAANEARSSLYSALAATRASPAVRSAAASRCKVKIAAVAKSVVGDALHLHGGIGITTEYPVGHLYRRAMVDDLLLGGGTYHLALLEGAFADELLSDMRAPQPLACKRAANP